MNASLERPAAASTFLAVKNLTMQFGGIRALSDVSFAVERGGITGLIGPNGAGKTTCFNCITRLYQPTSGSVELDGDDLLKVAPHRISGRRISRTFQNVALFANMTVLENVLVGFHSRLSRKATDRIDEKTAKNEAIAYLDYLHLAHLADTPVAGLPYGTRKTVELARALGAKPELLLLDEPAAGLNHTEVDALGETFVRLSRDFGTTILMVEHHMGLVMGISSHIVVLDSGKKLADGSPSAIQRNDAVIEAYLGAA